MSRSRLIREEQAAYPITLLCRVLRVARSADDAWAGRGASTRARADEALTAQIAAAHTRSRRTFGAPRIHAALRAAARTATFAWLEVWYNRQRRHSALNYQSPVVFEEDVLLSRPAA